MSVYPACLDRLIEQLARLPGIGKKSAERLAFHLVTRHTDNVRPLADAMTAAVEAIRACSVCHGISEEDVCGICRDPSRKDDLLCVVEQARDVFALERGAVFRGRYHVLGGVISPLSGIGPEHLQIDDLVERVSKNDVSEVILALNPSTEGETTSMYLAELLKDRAGRISRIAYGLPVGGELEFSDPVTLAKALEGRQPLE